VSTLDRRAEVPLRTVIAQRLVRLQRRAPAIQIVVLVALVLYGSATIPALTSSFSIRALLVLAALLGLAAAGQTFVILLGGIDFSVASYISGGAITFTTLVGQDHWSPVLAIVALVVGAAVLGGLTGFICHRFEVQPLIVTLAGGSMILGVVLVWTSGGIGGTVPTWLSNLSSPAGRTFGIAVPPVIIIWAIVGVILAVILHRTVAGRQIYATGSNIRAARLALVNTERVWTGVFAFSAASAVIAGVLLAGFSGGSSPTIGSPYLFEALTAVIVGGTTVGGNGDYWYTTLGAMILVVLTTILVSKGFNASDTEIVFGVLILLAVAGYGRGVKPANRI